MEGDLELDGAVGQDDTSGVGVPRAKLGQAHRHVHLAAAAGGHLDRGEAEQLGLVGVLAAAAVDLHDLDDSML